MIDKHEEQVKAGAQRRPVQSTLHSDQVQPVAAQPQPSSHTMLGTPGNVLRSVDLLALQRTVGNQAVGRELAQRSGDAIQRETGKKTANAPNDIDQLQQKFTPNFTPKSNDAPVDFQVTVAVAQGLPEYLTFAKKRMQSTIRNKARSAVRSLQVTKPVVRKAKSSTEIKEKAARKAAGKAPTTPMTDPAVKNIIDNSDSVGHTWIKMSTYNAQGALIKTYSFGFIPATGAPHGPMQAVPGMVRNPDMEFETEPNKRYLDSNVNAAAYKSALRKVTALMGGPPAYMTGGYNCTQFAKDVAKAAGAAFPSKAGLMIPISDRGFRQRALNPNAVYDKIGNVAGVHSDSPEQQMMEDDDLDMTENKDGMLVDRVDALNGDDVRDLIFQYRYVASTKAEWEKNGLRAGHLPKLTDAHIKELTDQGVKPRLIFTYFGVPMKGQTTGGPTTGGPTTGGPTTGGSTAMASNKLTYEEIVELIEDNALDLKASGFTRAAWEAVGLRAADLADLPQKYTMPLMKDGDQYNIRGLYQVFGVQPRRM